MSGTKPSRDQTWEKVIETLAQDGRLDKFFKTPRHERKAALQLYGRDATKDLNTLFQLILSEKHEDAQTFLNGLESYRATAMIQILVRSMQCWTETDNLVPAGQKTLWKVAHA